MSDFPPPPHRLLRHCGGPHLPYEELPATAHCWCGKCKQFPMTIEADIIEQMDMAHQLFMCYVAAAEETCKRYGHLVASIGTAVEDECLRAYKEARAAQDLLRSRLPS